MSKRVETSFNFRQILALLMACLLAVGALQGQAVSEDEIKFASREYIPGEANAIRVKSAMVPVPVVVRDAHGRAIKDLKKEDFELYEEGKKQDISYFTVEYAHPPATPAPETTAETPVAPPPAAAPRYLGMYFDDESTSTRDLVCARKAAEVFVRSHLEESDRVGIFTSSTTVTQEFTSNKQQLLDTLSKLVSHKRQVAIAACPNITPYQAYQITHFQNENGDALEFAMEEARQCHVCSGRRDCDFTVENLAEQVLSLSELFSRESLGALGDVIRYMGKMPGRRILIMTSSGFFSESETIQHEQDKMIDVALHNGIVINTLDPKGLFADHDPADEALGRPVATSGALGAYGEALPRQEKEVSNDPLAALAEGTGGKFFHNSNDLAGGLRQLAELPEVSYILGFSPMESKMNGAMRELKVKIPAQRNIRIESRPSYFLPTKAEAAPGIKSQKLDDEVMAQDAPAELAAQVKIDSSTLASGISTLKVIASVDGHSLLFKKENRRNRERVIFVTALFDMQGHFLAGTEGVMDMNLKDATHAQISRDGVNAKASLQAPPGTYRLREVIQEVVGGRISASSQTVEIH
jgi:VWFA-related protein